MHFADCLGRCSHGRRRRRRRRLRRKTLSKIFGLEVEWARKFSSTSQVKPWIRSYKQDSIVEFDSPFYAILTKIMLE